jgi:filamentous hemagglutinin family protein
MTAMAALVAACPALAGPTGGTVVEGAAAITQSGTVTNINQSTNKAIINWQGFSVGANETVNFWQPSAMSVTLNRVIGNEQSVIAGALNANGRVFIVNSAGVLITNNAQVNVGGLVASTLNISNADFMAGNYVFSGSSAASVVNRGGITAADGGYVALLGRTVSNEGAITAKLGTIALASGDQITLNFGGDSLVDVTVDTGTLNALIENKGAIKADGGAVVLTAKAADALLSAQVNNSGIIQARTLADLTGGSSAQGTVKIGKIKMLASGGTTRVSGKLDASAPNGGKGGTIDTSGDKVKIADGAVITTKSASSQNGEWVIDPDGFTIAASGGDITGATLSAQLADNNVTIYSTQGSGINGQDTGDIDVNDAVSWASSSMLALNANGSIHVNAPISAASGGLQLNAGWDISVNAENALGVARLDANASGNTLYIKAEQNWTNAGAWTLSGANVYINKALTWSTDSTLTLAATKSISVNAAIKGTSAVSQLVMTAGTDINVNVASAFVASSLNVNATHYLNINAEQNWTTLSGAWTLSGGAISVYDKINWSGTTPLTLSSTEAINIYATISAGFNAEAFFKGISVTPTLALVAGTDINLGANSVLSIDTKATAGNNLNIIAPQDWVGGSWTLAARNVNVDDTMSLAFGNLTLEASENINVNAPISWWSGTLTLDAGANIFVNSVMSESFYGNLVANFGTGMNADGTPNGMYMGLANPGAYSGRIDFAGAGKLTINDKLYTIVNSVAALDAIANGSSGNYALGSSLSNLSWGDLQPFLSSSGFQGNFNGLGHSLALAPQSSITIGAPLTIGDLKNTNLQFASLSNIDINASVTSGAGLLTLIAAGDINLGASLSSGADSLASFALVGTNITIDKSVSVTGGNIFIDAPLSWSANTLTLDAKQFINLNAALTASGTARLVLSYAEGTKEDGTPSGGLNAAYDGLNGAFIGKVDFVGNTASDALTINSHPYILISSMADLAAISDQTDVYFALAKDLDAAGAGSNADGSYSGAVVAGLWSPLEGLGHTVSNLSINDTTGNGMNGLIGLNGSPISNIAVKNAYVNGGFADNNGGLIGLNAGAVTNVYAFGVKVTSQGAQDGGLIGLNTRAVINNAHAYNVDVTGGTIGAGYSSVGGLVGFNMGFGGTSGVINNSSASGVVGATEPNSADDVRSSYGGLVGTNYGGAINNSVAYVDISFLTHNTDSLGRVNPRDGEAIGGLVGTNTTNGDVIGTITNSVAYGNVTSVADYLGGLVGYNQGGDIIKSRAYGKVENNSPSIVSAIDGSEHPGSIGGLVGATETVASFASGQLLDIGGNIVNSAAYGEVYAPHAGSVGGLVGSISKGVNLGPVVVGGAAYGNVTGGFAVGGFFGSNLGGIVANSTASGDVSGTNVGGFGGSNGHLSLVIHSSASGNVTFNGDPADVVTGTGGFLGFNSGSVVNSTSSGAVNGNANVGGFIGWNLASNSVTGTGFVGPGNSTTSRVTGVDAATTAGFIGTNGGGTILGGTFVTQPGQPSNGVGRQDGENSEVTSPTDPRVAAQNAAAAQQNNNRAAQVANVVASDQERSVKTNRPSSSTSGAGKKAVEGSITSAKLEEQAKIEDPAAPPVVEERKPKPQRHATSGPAHKHGGGQGGGSFGAKIRSIDVDGQRYDLNGSQPKNR